MKSPISVVFFRLTKLFFRNKNFLSKEQLLFSFLCIKKAKKFGVIQKFFFLKIYLTILEKKKFSTFSDHSNFFFVLQYIKNWTKVVPWTKFFYSWKKSCWSKKNFFFFLKRTHIWHFDSCFLVFSYHVIIIWKQNWQCIFAHPSLSIFEWCAISLQFLSSVVFPLLAFVFFPIWCVEKCS